MASHHQQGRWDTPWQLTWNSGTEGNCFHHYKRLSQQVTKKKTITKLARNFVAKHFFLKAGLRFVECRESQSHQ